MIQTGIATAFIVLLLGALVTIKIRSWRTAGWVSVIFVGVGTVFILRDGVGVLTTGHILRESIVSLPAFGSNLEVVLDPLGAGFGVLIAIVSFIATLYSVEYMASYQHENPGRFYTLLQLFIAGMIGVVSVADWLFFIVFWELMTMVSYFLVTFERDKSEAIRAGFKYFVMTHVATAGLLLSTVVLWRVTGSFSFEEHRIALGGLVPSVRSLLLALYLLAFTTKAGIFPMGDWLPDAHPFAPSGISAIMSGVMIKLGVYGVLRVFWLTLPGVVGPSELMNWGMIIAFLGVLSAFVSGVAAMRENDAKRLLAFSSMSQAGYILLALGIAIAFSRSRGMASVTALGVLASGFHVLNDALYKSLLFMNAGSVLYSTGSRDLNKIGGLLAVVPWVAMAGLIGVVSLAGLPPSNGFASKWLIYQTAISGGIKFAPFLAAAVVAFFVSLSTLAYALKYFNTAFLGKPAQGRKPPSSVPLAMTVAQWLAATLCILVGLVPALAIKVVGISLGISPADTVAIERSGALLTLPASGAIPASWSPLSMFTILLVVFSIGELIRRSGRANVRSVPSWYCGEEHTDDEVRYRAHGFYQPFNLAFENVYPRIPVPRLPSLKGLRSVLSFDNWLYNPLLRWGGRLTDKVSRSHVGIPQLYMIWQVAGMILVLALLFLLVK